MPLQMTNVERVAAWLDSHPARRYDTANAIAWAIRQEFGVTVRPATIYKARSKRGKPWQGCLERRIVEALRTDPAKARAATALLERWLAKRWGIVASRRTVNRAKATFRRGL